MMRAAAVPIVCYIALGSWLPCAAQVADLDFPVLSDGPASTSPAASATASTATLDAASSPDASPGKASWRGELSLKLHYAPLAQRTDYPFARTAAGTTQQRATLWLQGDIPVAWDTHIHVSGQANHDGVVGAGQAASRAELHEAYVELKPARHVQLRLGQQLAPLGVSDFFQLADVINPRDEEVLGLADLRDARLPVLASKLSYNLGRLSLQAIVQHAFRPNRYAASGDDFDPFITVGGRNNTQTPDSPRLAHSPDVVLRAVGSQAWGDWFVQLGRVHDATPIPISLINGQLSNGYQPTLHWSAGGNYVAGDWVLKTELAHNARTRQLRSDIGLQLAQGLKPEVSDVAALSKWMVGASYVGFSGLEVNAELLTEKVHGNASQQVQPGLRHAGIVNFQGSAYKDKLKFGLLLGKWWRGSGLVRTEASYDISDKLRVKTSVIDYQGGADNAPLAAVRRNRRAALAVSYAL
jgi:hypothetical protein